MKSALKKVAVLLVVFVFSSLSGVSMFNKSGRDINNNSYIEVFAEDDIRVTTADLNLRSGPGTQYSVIAVMPKGTRVTVLSVSGSWAKVIYGSKEGYAHTAYMTQVTTQTMVTTANLNMRTGPSTSYSIIRVIPNGVEVRVISTSNGWARVIYGGSEGYASLSYLKTLSTLPSTGETVMVTTANLNMRTGPSISYSIIRVIPMGAEVKVLSTSSGWARVVYGGSEGYASLSYLKLKDTLPSTGETIMVTTAYLNMRTGPSTSYSIIRVIPMGAEVKVLSTSAGWARVVYGGSEGYASLSYLRLVTESTDVRVTTEELNLRSGPGVTYSIIAVMPAGAEVIVLSVSGDWARVNYQGKIGYAHTGYLVKEAAVASSTVITRGLVSASAKQIALTFDAGWEFATTIPLLNMLDQQGVKATFFLRALWVSDHPELAKEILKRGHSIQNHSLTHPHMNEMTEAEIRKEFTDSTAIFRNVLGITPTLFRPPFGEYNSTVLKVAGEQGYKYTVMWSIDTVDWATTHNDVTVDADYIIDRVLSKVTDKDIVLMHIAYMKTVEALPEMIQTLKDRGYTFKTVPQMVP
ncbi:SH3 domain-containing protein [Proteiniclasticum sp. C24MP]|uniref:SH3 domain-containing protein n=1 Tax=Proteiniclasticum sp. C24MP TaxID=3374101 RepID=UPI003754BA18